MPKMKKNIHVSMPATDWEANFTELLRQFDELFELCRSIQEDNSKLLSFIRNDKFEKQI